MSFLCCFNSHFFSLCRIFRAAQVMNLKRSGSRWLLPSAWSPIRLGKKSADGPDLRLTLGNWCLWSVLNSNWGPFHLFKVFQSKGVVKEVNVLFQWNKASQTLQGTSRNVSVLLQHCRDNLVGLSRCWSSGQVCQHGPRKGREGVRETKKHDRIW